MSELKQLRRKFWLIQNAAQIARVAIVITGLFLTAAFIADGNPGAVTAALCVVAFVAGGIRIAVGSMSSETMIAIDAGTAITFGAAIACGPICAAGPAAMAALGRILLDTSHQEPFPRSVYRVTRLPVQGAITGLVFLALGGQTSDPTAIASLPAIFAAAVTFVLIDRLLSLDSPAFMSLWLSAGAGYGLGGATAILPQFAILAAALPVAVALLRLLHRRVRSSEQAQEKEEAAKPSLIDPLTGLANQRYMEMFMSQEISRSERSGQPITVFLIDIDNFARLNESEGKDEGDRCLTALGGAIKDTVREYDLAARYKDDEFVVILPETDTAAGYEIANRLHATVSGQILPHRLTFSIGVAGYPTYGTTSDDLLSSAHHALNRAKFSGKNTIRSCHLLAKAS